jgi:hypothetical protein
MSNSSTIATSSSNSFTSVGENVSQTTATVPSGFFEGYAITENVHPPVTIVHPTQSSSIDLPAAGNTSKLTNIKDVTPIASTSNPLTLDTLRAFVEAHPQAAYIAIHHNGEMVARNREHLTRIGTINICDVGTIEKLRNLLTESGYSALTRNSLLNNQLPSSQGHDGSWKRLGEDPLTPQRLREILDLVASSTVSTQHSLTQTPPQEVTTHHSPGVRDAALQLALPHQFLNVDKLLAKIDALDSRNEYFNPAKHLLKQGIEYARKMTKTFTGICDQGDEKRKFFLLKNVEAVQGNLDYFLTMAEEIILNANNILEARPQAQNATLPEGIRNHYQTAIEHAQASIAQATQFGNTLNGNEETPGSPAQARSHSLESLRQRALSQATRATAEAARGSNFPVQFWTRKKSQARVQEAEARVQEAEARAQEAKATNSSKRGVWRQVAEASAQAAEARAQQAESTTATNCWELTEWEQVAKARFQEADLRAQQARATDPAEQEKCCQQADLRAQQAKAIKLAVEARAQQARATDPAEQEKWCQKAEARAQQAKAIRHAFEIIFHQERGYDSNKQEALRQTAELKIFEAEARAQQAEATDPASREVWCQEAETRGLEADARLQQIKAIYGDRALGW